VRRARQVYLVIGIFGAARYGDATAGDILVNTWLGGFPEGLLDLAMGAYLSMSIPPISVCPSERGCHYVPVTQLVAGVMLPLAYLSIAKLGCPNPMSPCQMDLGIFGATCCLPVYISISPDLAGQPSLSLSVGTWQL